MDRTYNAGDDCGFGPLIPEGLFIPNSILYNNNRRLSLANSGCNCLDSGNLINCLVGTDNIIVRLARLSWAFEHFSGVDGVFTVVLRVNYKTLLIHY